MAGGHAPRKVLGHCVIDARTRWNHTGMVLEEGKQYDFEAAAGESWRDGAMTCGPDGYDSDRLRRLEHWRRAPFAKWLALIGTLGTDMSTAFPVGSGKQNYIPLRSGELCCFANDVWFMYWNNRGSVAITVYERAARPVTGRGSP